MRIPLERLFAEPPITGRPLEGVRWHPVRSCFTYLEKSEGDQGDLWACHLETGERELLLVGSALGKAGGRDPRPSLGGYDWFPDGERLLLAAKGRAWACGLKETRPQLLLKGIDPQVRPHFSPSGDRLAFVRGGDLWILSLDSGEERPLTRDGSETVLNGKLDWIYWEELAHRKSWRAFEWSPDGEKIAYLRLDQSRVPRYPLADLMQTQPRVLRQHYPRAGDPNASPSIHIVHVSQPDHHAYVYCPGAYIAPALAWTPDSRAVAWSCLQRDQRSLDLQLCSTDASPLSVLLRESDPHWLNAIGPPLFLPDGDFLWLSEASGRAHVYRHAPDGTRRFAVTEGPWQVERLHGTDPDHVFLLGTWEDPCERHVYRARLDGSGCERLTPRGGVHGVDRRPQGGWMLVTSEDARTPASTRLLRDSEDRGPVVREPDPGWRDYDWAEYELLPLTAGDGTPLHGRLLRPRGFDPSRRYPVLVHVYGGPHAQTVLRSWAGSDPLEQLLAQEEILVWRLDNRGSWGRGHAFETPVDRRLGTVELEDQLRGVEHLKTLPYVDPDRIGIAGWSYGGYLALYALTHAPEVWRCGIAGAPVTDWKLYDSVYTERYMGTPQENSEGYRAGSILEAADQLRAPLLLIHGTEDDNVHLQHTIHLVDALSRHRKPYELLLQPGQKHGFTGPPARTYLHERMVEFLVRHLGG